MDAVSPVVSVTNQRHWPCDSWVSAKHLPHLCSVFVTALWQLCNIVKTPAGLLCALACGCPAVPGGDALLPDTFLVPKSPFSPTPVAPVQDAADDQCCHRDPETRPSDPVKAETESQRGGGHRTGRLDEAEDQEDPTSDNLAVPPGVRPCIRPLRLRTRRHVFMHHRGDIRIPATSESVGRGRQVSRASGGCGYPRSGFRCLCRGPRPAPGSRCGPASARVAP